ncbi:DnaD domain-containing protein [Sporosarcina sp. ACRSM]|uniref:DnaD domain-containing protein n=1 Tax=Sporosarcina sp. ACRSM TaxID=2918216 RepID=UPI001EF5F828|nr:DnaD domain-containing protein [Sporosarcina sp. ACRSM]MCG7333852.1 DnaD domain-containing protein [Sporosarcina sp. ACRSM]
MQHEERLRIWIEQGNVNISQLFFHHYKKLGIQDIDAMLIMHMTAFQSGGIQFPTPTDFSDRMNLTENEVSMILQRLMQRGFLQIVQSKDPQGVLVEIFSLQPLWDRLVDQLALQANESEEENQKKAEGEIYALFEQEFGRFLSPMECESIAMWLDEDGHSVEIIRAALKEAVIAQKLSLRYIDRILFEWKKKNVKTLADVERQTKSFRTIGPRPDQPQQRTVSVKRVPFYNWLEERD